MVMGDERSASAKLALVGGDPMMAWTGGGALSSEGEAEMMLADGDDLEDREEDRVDEKEGSIFTRPLRDAIREAFVRTLTTLDPGREQTAQGPPSEMCLSPEAHSDLASSLSDEDRGNMTLKETIELGFKNVLSSFTRSLSQEELCEVTQEAEKIEHELFLEDDEPAQPVGDRIEVACVKCIASADALLNFLDGLRESKTVSPLLKVIDTFRPKDLEDAKRQCEAIKATVEAVRAVVEPLRAQSTIDSKCVGRDLQDSPASICNGFDSILTILLQLLNGITETIRIIFGLQNKYFDMIWWSNYNHQLSQHLAQLRRVYGIIYTCAVMTKQMDTSKSLLVGTDAQPELEPEILKSVIKSDEMFGRYFGFHYPLEIRSVLQVINIARESTSSAIAASPAARNVAFLGYFVLYGHMVALHQMGLDVKNASSIGADKKDVETIENARLYLNLIDDPILIAGSKFATPDPYYDRPFKIELEDREPVEARLISFQKRPIYINLAENWVEKQVTSLLRDDVLKLRDDVMKEVDALSTKIDVYMNPGARTLAKGLILHFHGGGFIGQSSKSHACYVRLWAAALPDAVILSVDYKLAPEHKYPYAVEEGFAAYKWALENASSLGTLADKVAFCGDSAGGNIATAVAMRCLERGVRPPCGLVLAYPAMFLSLRFSASRVLAFFDPMLPYTLLRLCLQAYVPDGVDPTKDPFISPMVTPDDILERMPPMSIFSGAFDPLLDDSVELIHRMRRVGRTDAKMRIYENLPHGFLGMVPVLDDAMKAAKEMAMRIAEVLETDCAEVEETPLETPLESEASGSEHD